MVNCCIFVRFASLSLLSHRPVLDGTIKEKGGKIVLHVSMRLRLSCWLRGDPPSCSHSQNRVTMMASSIHLACHPDVKLLVYIESSFQ